MAPVSHRACRPCVNSAQTNCVRTCRSNVRCALGHVTQEDPDGVDFRRRGFAHWGDCASWYQHD